MYLVLLSCLLMNPTPDEIKLAQYFVKNRTDTGLIQDRESNKNIVSIAATGFGMTAWAIASQYDVISKEQATAWVHQTIDFVFLKNPKRNKGWLYHFLDREGEPLFCKEISSIDTAIFYLGARKAAQILKDNELAAKINKYIDNIDVKWMLSNNGIYPNKKFFSHGFHWINDQPVFIGYNWEEYSEGVLIYKLFNVPYKYSAIQYDLPLFVYYYPLCFFDDPELIDNLKKAIQCQIDRYDFFGVTACDGPIGYTVNDPKVVSPLTIWAVSPYEPRSKSMIERFGVSRTTPAISVHTGWKAEDRIGIDDGSCLLMIFRTN